MSGGNGSDTFQPQQLQTQSFSELVSRYMDANRGSDPRELTIVQKVDSLFEDEHLAKDVQMLLEIRKHNGAFVSLAFLLSHEEVKKLNTDKQHLAAALREHSKVLELNRDGNMVRRIQPVSVTVPDIEELVGRCLMVENLPELLASSQTLRSVFSNFGMVDSVNVYHPHHVKKGGHGQGGKHGGQLQQQTPFAVVLFATVQDVEQAAKSMQEQNKILGLSVSKMIMPRFPNLNNLGKKMVRLVFHVNDAGYVSVEFTVSQQQSVNTGVFLAPSPKPQITVDAQNMLQQQVTSRAASIRTDSVSSTMMVDAPVFVPRSHTHQSLSQQQQVHQQRQQQQQQQQIPSRRNLDMNFTQPSAAATMQPVFEQPPHRAPPFGYNNGMDARGSSFGRNNLGMNSNLNQNFNPNMNSNLDLLATLNANRSVSMGMGMNMNRGMGTGMGMDVQNLRQNIDATANANPTPRQTELTSLLRQLLEQQQLQAAQNQMQNFVTPRSVSLNSSTALPQMRAQTQQSLPIQNLQNLLPQIQQGLQQGLPPQLALGQLSASLSSQTMQPQSPQGFPPQQYPQQILSPHAPPPSPPQALPPQFQQLPQDQPPPPTSPPSNTTLQLNTVRRSTSAGSSNSSASTLAAATPPAPVSPSSTLPISENKPELFNRSQSQGHKAERDGLKEMLMAWETADDGTGGKDQTAGPSPWTTVPSGFQSVQTRSQRQQGKKDYASWAAATPGMRAAAKTRSAPPLEDDRQKSPSSSPSWVPKSRPTFATRGDSAETHVRIAKTPDGTKGFAAGRGRPVVTNNN
eukprot:TRINITY_DN4661_c0_g1_i3.p1 TRINITY_DN4661_c0_g1~~TRINITY_DN4661_c0_g1_i3.p1  ORF type:complete len:796 (-),score=92.70 TRINITY_DN4661_c0_g1_i3:2511-4898(-)